MRSDACPTSLHLKPDFLLTLLAFRRASLIPRVCEPAFMVLSGDHDKETYDGVAKRVLASSCNFFSMPKQDSSLNFAVKKTFIYQTS